MMWLGWAAGPALADPAAALGYAPKYLPDFSHFDYVNPDAPKGGRITLPGFGDFDSFNPYLLKGVAAEGLGSLMFETLMVQSQDEPYSVYPLLAEDIELAQDGLSVRFRLDPRARFSNGDPVTAEAVRFSFETLMADPAHPQFRFYWADIEGVEVLGPREVRFNFKRVNPELHMIAAQIPIFSPAWLEAAVAEVADPEIQPFAAAGRVAPIASGPYLIDRFERGKRIVYRRNPDYWAAEHPSRRGMFNFDEVVYKYYRDEAVMLEALKAGEFDFMFVLNSKAWARDYVGPQFDDGRILRHEFAHHNNAGMQGFVYNTRRERFADRRVRRALTLAFDFEWSNENLFYGQYRRCDSYFSNSELAARGVPDRAELELLEPWREQLPAELFQRPWQAPVAGGPMQLRKNLRQAKRLLEEAGWTVEDGVLQKDGVPFRFEVLLAQKGFERILAPYAHTLRKLGIEMRYRTVDVSLYIERRKTFDFDVMVASFSQSQSPGNELFNMFHSRSLDQQGSSNLPGINDPVVDDLVEKLVFAKDREALVTAAHALDRVLLWGEYLMPNWYIDTHRVAHWTGFQRPQTLPLYYQAESWALQTWWAAAEARQ